MMMYLNTAGMDGTHGNRIENANINVALSLKAVRSPVTM